MTVSLGLYGLGLALLVAGDTIAGVATSVAALACLRVGQLIDEARR